MSTRLRGEALREIRTLFDLGAVGSWTDGQLVSELAMSGDGSEAALRVLIERHGGMVLGICRRILGDEAAAEDAFQATFLVLMSKAGSLGESAMLTNWIYGVALRVAKKERSRTAQRRVVERTRGVAGPAMPSRELEYRELKSVIDEEIGMLPERYRLPVILCYFEGMRHEEAARQLGCAVGTVESRLSRAKDRLRARLSRRGLAPDASIIGAVLSGRDSLTASMGSTLVNQTIAAATRAPAEVAGGIGALLRWVSVGIGNVGQLGQVGVAVSTMVLGMGLVEMSVARSGGGGGFSNANAAGAVAPEGVGRALDGGEEQKVKVTVEFEDKAKVKLEGVIEDQPKAKAADANVNATLGGQAIGNKAKVLDAAEPTAADSPELRTALERPLTEKMLKPERPASAQAAILSNITIDGELNDWPPAIARYPIERLLLVNGIGTSGLQGKNLSTSGDLSSAFSVGYDPRKELLYLALIVRDDKTVVGHASHLDTDSVEVFIDGLHDDRQLHVNDQEFADLQLADVPVQQYVAIPAKGMIYGKRQATNPILMAGSLHKTKTKMSYITKGEVTTYEWSIQIFDKYPDRPTKLVPGKRIGFDVAIVDKDVASASPGGFDDPEGDRSAWIFWSPLWRGNKMLDSGGLGELILVK